MTKYKEVYGLKKNMIKWFSTLNFYELITGSFFDETLVKYQNHVARTTKKYSYVYKFLQKKEKVLRELLNKSESDETLDF